MPWALDRQARLSFAIKPLRRACQWSRSAVEAFEQRVELLQAGFNNKWLRDRRRYCLDSFVTITGDRNDHALIGMDAFLGDQLERHGKCRAASRLSKYPLGTR